MKLNRIYDKKVTFSISEQPDMPNIWDMIFQQGTYNPDTKEVNIVLDNKSLNTFRQGREGLPEIFQFCSILICT